MRLFDVDGHDKPLLLSDEHAEILSAKPHRVVRDKPVRSANKQTWADYALAQGADPSLVETQTRAELIDSWG